MPPAARVDASSDSPRRRPGRPRLTEPSPEYVHRRAEIIETARRHLASYQKPRSVEFVDALPKAPTGKILKRALREPYWADRDRSV